MKRFNIVTSKKYTKKDGEEKTQWNTVGTLVRFDATQERDEGYILELNMFPDTKFSVFEQKPREERTQEPAVASAAKEEEIDVDDIPF